MSWRTCSGGREPLLPGNGRPGGQRAGSPQADQRGAVQGPDRVPWPDLPERYGPWPTVYERHRRWSADSTWKAVLEELQIEADVGDPEGALVRRVGRTEWAVNIDLTSCRAHQRPGGASCKPRADHRQRRAGRVRRQMGARR
ncbi:transposase [Streptomyces sp. NPDC002143]